MYIYNCTNAKFLPRLRLLEDLCFSARSYRSILLIKPAILAVYSFGIACMLKHLAEIIFPILLEGKTSSSSIDKSLRHVIPSHTKKRQVESAKHPTMHKDTRRQGHVLAQRTLSSEHFEALSMARYRSYSVASICNCLQNLKSVTRGCACVANFATK